MDMILAINNRTPVRRKLHKEPEDEGERIKRMNVTKFSNGTMVITNTSEVLNSTDVLIQANLGMANIFAHEIFQQTDLLGQKTHINHAHLHLRTYITYFYYISEEKVADNLLEGDILLDPRDPEDYKIAKLIKEEKKEEAEHIFEKRQAMRKLKHLWHSRIVPYEIDPSLGMNCLCIIRVFERGVCIREMSVLERGYVSIREGSVLERLY